MTSLGRLAAALVVVAVCVALPFARTPAGPAPAAHPAHAVPAAREPAVPTIAFTSAGLSFRYPATWQRQPWSGDAASFATPIVILNAGGALVSWDADGFPGFHMPKPNATIGGHPAIETRASTRGWCAALGGTEMIAVTIPRALPDNWFQMDACLRTPGLAQQEAQIAAMLRTVQLVGGP